MMQVLNIVNPPTSNSRSLLRGRRAVTKGLFFLKIEGIPSLLRRASIGLIRGVLRIAGNAGHHGMCLAILSLIAIDLFCFEGINGLKSLVFDISFLVRMFSSNQNRFIYH